MYQQRVNHYAFPAMSTRRRKCLREKVGPEAVGGKVVWRGETGQEAARRVMVADEQCIFQLISQMRKLGVENPS